MSLFLIIQHNFRGKETWYLKYTFKYFWKKAKMDYVSISECKSILLCFSKSISASIRIPYLYSYLYLPVSASIYGGKWEKYTKDILLSTSPLIVKYSMLFISQLLLQKHSFFFSTLLSNPERLTCLDHVIKSPIISGFHLSSTSGEPWHWIWRRKNLE